MKKTGKLIFLLPEKKFLLVCKVCFEDGARKQKRKQLRYGHVNPLRIQFFIDRVSAETYPFASKPFLTLNVTGFDQ